MKIGSVLTDGFGVSGLHMLLALPDGRAASEEIAGLAHGSAKRKAADHRQHSPTRHVPDIERDSACHTGGRVCGRAARLAVIHLR